MADDLTRLPAAVRLARRARANITQNIALSLASVAVLVAAALAVLINLTETHLWGLDHGDFALIFGTPAPGYQAPESLTGPAAARFAAVPLGVYAAAARAGAAAPDRTQIPETLAVGRLMQDLAGEGGGGLLPRVAGIALNAWASVLGYLTLEIFGSLTRLIADTDELYRAHVHTVMLGMGFDPDLTSTARSRSTSPGRFNAHGA